MAATRRPLTAVERRRLLLDCIPFLVLLAATLVVAAIWSDLTPGLLGRRTSLVLAVVLGSFLLITGWTALNRVRDVLAGTAVVEQDHLKRLWRPRRGALGGDCFGTFERLGRLRMSPTEFGRAGLAFDLAQLHHPDGVSGARAPVVFRVAYSPASRIAWSVTQV